MTDTSLSNELSVDETTTVPDSVTSTDYDNIDDPELLLHLNYWTRGYYCDRKQ